MAARDRTWTPEKVRQKIRTSMLINRLQNHVLGRIEMSKTQIAAAGILIKKVLPDMVAQTVEHRPLEGMSQDDLNATLLALRGYLASQSADSGAGDPPKGEPACEVQTVQ